MPLGQLLKARSYSRRVRLPPLLQVLESFLPQLLDIGKVTDVLSNRPLPLELKSRAGVVQADKQRVKSRQSATKSFAEIRQHPWRVTEGELPLRPWRAVELRRDLNRMLNGVHHDRLVNGEVSAADHMRSRRSHERSECLGAFHSSAVCCNTC